MKWILMFVFAVFVQTVYSQTWAGSTTTSNVAYRDGSILVGDVTMHSSVGASDRVIELAGTNNLIYMRSNVYSGGLAFYFTPSPPFGPLAGIRSSTPFSIGVNGLTPMYFPSTGNVLIGKTTQVNTGYILDVNGTTRANAVVVNTTGADFVFASGYRLPTLPEIENYIREHQHLPGIAAALEMQQQGMDLGANQTCLLQKVEELTLYAIDQKKQIDEQRALIAGQARLLQAQQEALKQMQATLDEIKRKE